MVFGFYVAGAACRRSGTLVEWGWGPKKGLAKRHKSVESDLYRFEAYDVDHEVVSDDV